MRTHYVNRKPTVLVVDDTPSVLTMISDLLKDEYQIKVAAFGMRALEIARSPTPPDLILLDVLMPDIDGYAVCRELKSHVETQDIPVIFLTARTDPADEERGLMLGAVDYIAKPISPPVVLARIRTQLQLRSYAERLRTLVNIHAREVQHTRSRFEQVLQSALELAYITDYQAAVQAALQGGLAILNCDAGCYLARSDHATLVLAAHTLPVGFVHAEIPLKDAQTGQANTLDACARSLHHSETLVIDDITQDARFDSSSLRHIDSAANYDTLSVLVVPVAARQGAPVGVLCFQNALGPQPGPVVPFDDRDIAYIEALAGHFAGTLHRLRA